MIYRGENYFSGAYFSPSPIRDTSRWKLILGDNSSDYWCGSASQQMRRAGLNAMRYFRCHVAGIDYSITQFGQANLGTVQKYWNDVLSLDLDDEVGSPFCHSASPVTSSNRQPFTMPSYSFIRARFAQANWLEFLLGADETGIRSTDHQPGDVITRMLWEADITYLFHDNFTISSYLTYSGTNTSELRYASTGDYETAWFDYCAAIRDRLRRPRNIKMITNLGSVCMYPGQTSRGGGTKTFKDFVDADLIDGLYQESIMAADMSWWNPSKPQPWYGYMLVTLLRNRMLFANDKTLIGDANLMLPSKFALSCPGSASPKTFAYNGTTRVLTVTLGVNVYNYTITTSSTWADIKSFLESCYDPSSNYIVVSSEYSENANWTGISPNDCMFTNIATTTIADSVGIAGLSRAYPCVVTYYGHGKEDGQYVTLAGITQTEWSALNGRHQVTRIDANTFSIPEDTSGFAVVYNAATDPGIFLDSSTALAVSQTPRETLVTLAAVMALSAIEGNSSAYPIGKTGSNIFYDCDLYDAFPLLGSPDFVHQPLTTETLNGYDFEASWNKIDLGWGDVYYRLYTNGVVFLNWTTTDRTVYANNALWGARAAWYPMAEKVDGEFNIFVHPTDARSESSPSVTIRAKSGEICLFEV